MAYTIIKAEPTEENIYELAALLQVALPEHRTKVLRVDTLDPNSYAGKNLLKTISSPDFKRTVALSDDSALKISSDILNSNGQKVYYALDGRNVIGFAYIQAFSDSHFYIHDIYVTPSNRRHHAATEILEAIISDIERTNKQPYWKIEGQIAVWDIPSVSLAEKMGFRNENSSETQTQHFSLHGPRTTQAPKIE